VTEYDPEEVNRGIIGEFGEPIDELDNLPKIEDREYDESEYLDESDQKYIRIEEEIMNRTVEEIPLSEYMSSKRKKDTKT
jgi:hypothetical protein